MMINDSSVFVTNRTLFDKNNSKYLVDNVEIGDYIDIGINYSNADMSIFDSKYVNGNYGETGPLGWRVLNKNGFGVTGKVTLISAGCPLEFWNNNSNLELSMPILDNLSTKIDVKDITSNNINFENDFFVKNGFVTNDLDTIFNQCEFIDKSSYIHGVTMDEIFDSYKVLMNEKKNFKDFFNSNNSLLTSHLIKRNDNYNLKAIDLISNGFDYGISGFYKNNNYCKILSNGKTTTINDKNSNLCLVRPIITLQYNLELDRNNIADGNSNDSAYKVKFGEF